MSLKTKLIVLAVGFVIILAHVTWYTINYIKIERSTVLSLSSQEFRCSQDQIVLGSSYQYNDGPSEIPVKGCGQEGVVLCYDDTHKQGMLGQYFSFDMICRLKRN